MFEKALKIICSVLLCACFVLHLVNMSVSRAEACYNEYPLLNFVIVLDAGHGGQDGGAIGIKTLTREKDVNLSITKKLKGLFESCGATVVLTREDDDALCKGDFDKMEDMSARARIIESVSPYIVISIHCNSFPQNKSVKGAQTFYYPGSETGQRLAETIQESLSKNVDEQNKRQIKSENFFMLRHGNSTSVMIECGFLSCPEEEALLLDQNHQEKLAYAIFDGTCNYISQIRTPENT
ncbi:MAG: N-acetylmuramoyl-L-alanine amidase [Clostridia bacterium]|nr:N-acetylmuramoyl-L-alanine amidase [Clostridia bacterium]